MSIFDNFQQNLAGVTDTTNVSVFLNLVEEDVDNYFQWKLGKYSARLKTEVPKKLLALAPLLPLQEDMDIDYRTVKGRAKLKTMLSQSLIRQADTRDPGSSNSLPSRLKYEKSGRVDVSSRRHGGSDAEISNSPVGVMRESSALPPPLPQPADKGQGNQRHLVQYDDSDTRNYSSADTAEDTSQDPLQYEASRVKLEDGCCPPAGEQLDIEMVDVKIEVEDELTDPVIKEEPSEFHEYPLEIQFDNDPGLDVKTKDTTSLEIENQRLTDENHRLNIKLQNFTNRIENLIQRHEKQKVKNDEQSIKEIESVFISNLRIDNQSLAEQNKSLARNIDAVIKQNHTQMREIQELTEKNISLSSKVHELSISNQRLTATVEKLKDNTNSRKDDAIKFMQKIEIVTENGSNVDAVIKQNHTQMREIQELTEKNISLSSKVHELGLGNQRLAATVERLKDDIKTRKDNENEFVKKIEILTEDASRLGDENERLRRQIQELTRTNKHTDRIEDQVIKKETVKETLKQELLLRNQHKTNTIQDQVMKETNKKKRKT